MFTIKKYLIRLWKRSRYLPKMFAREWCLKRGAIALVPLTFVCWQIVTTREWKSFKSISHIEYTHFYIFFFCIYLLYSFWNLFNPISIDQDIVCIEYLIHAKRTAVAGFTAQDNNSLLWRRTFSFLRRWNVFSYACARSSFDQWPYYVFGSVLHCIYLHFCIDQQ